METKHWILIIAVLVIAGIIIWLWPGGDSTEKSAASRFTPKLTIASMSITDINPNSISIVSKAVINNPLPLEINTTRLDYEIFIDSQRVVKSSYSKPLVIRSKGDTEIELPMEILSRDMAAVLKHFDEQKVDSADYTMKSNIQVDVPIAGERTFDVNMTKRLPAVRLPKITAGKVDLDKLGLKETSLGMDVLIENPNAFPIKMQDGRYSLTIDGDLTMDGVLEKLIVIPAKCSETVSMQMDMKTGKLPEMAGKFLFDKKGTTYNYKFTCKLVSDNSFLQNSTFSTTAKGTLDDLKNLVK